MSVRKIIEELKADNRVSPPSAHWEGLLREFEVEEGVVFPEAYKLATMAGDYDIANFYWREPGPVDEFPGFVVFAEWTEDLFAFELNDIRPGAGGAGVPVHVLVSGMKPEKPFDDFEHWFRHIVDMANRPVNPE